MKYVDSIFSTFLEYMDIREVIFFIMYLYVILKNKIIEYYEDYKKIKYE